jgi:radical SAM superfamily enzyme YgiQ (UPF0313 family)
MCQNIYLIDLTHDTPLGFGSDTMPLQLGLIAAHSIKEHGDKIDIQIFKFVEDLVEAVKKQPPFIIGSSNYVWNTDLSYQVISAIKEKYPETIVVFGGPNYPDVYEEQIEWLEQHSLVDFYIFRDGEIPFARLVGDLLNGTDVLTAQQAKLPSCHALVNGQPFFGELEPRVIHLDETPSPYTMGLMDKFFEQRLIPAIRTNRGCPFACTFCAEGHSYYTKIHKTSFERKKEDIDYIVSRVRHTKTLRIADSNFGMYEEDVELCRYLSEIQEKSGYPEFLNCATGKNRKDLVLECNRLLRGAMRFTASVQSLNPVVLENVKRKNISLDDIMALSDQISDTPTHAYSEIILALPGDSIEAEKESFAGLVTAGIGNITQHQLSIIPGTEIGSKAASEKYGMKSMCRPIQRCLGKYKVLDKEVISVEIEQVCVGNNTLPIEDYLEARRLYLTVSLFYNDRIFGEIHGFLRMLQLPTWDWLIRIHQHIDTAKPEIQNMYAEFTRETQAELWEDRNSLLADVSREIDQHVNGKMGGNLIYKYRARALVQHFPQLQFTAYKHLSDYLTEQNLNYHEEVRQLERFSQYQKSDIFNSDVEIDETFDIDIVRMIKEPELARQGMMLKKLCYPVRIRIAHTDAQRASIQRETEFYGRDLSGLTMLLSRYPIKRFYRNAAIVSNEIHHTVKKS